MLLPSSKEELAHMIKSAQVPPSNDVFGNDHPNRIRVVGSGHSWSKVAVSDVWLEMNCNRYANVQKMFSLKVLCSSLFLLWG